MDIESAPDNDMVVPVLAQLLNFPARLLNNRSMMGTDKRATQTRLIRDENPTMMYNLSCV
jgi:hypothetical protein